MKIKALGHAVLRVSDLAKAEAFYNGLLGIPVCARLDEHGMKMTFFTLGNHHDLAIMEVSGEGGSHAETAVGLHHVAFNIGTDLDELRDARSMLEAAGIAPDPVDHGVTKSLYFSDPDGNGVELYVDVSDAWRRDPSMVAYAAPMTL